MNQLRKFAAPAVLLVGLSAFVSASAVPLSGSGDHLPLPATPGVPIPSVGATYIGTPGQPGFSGFFPIPPAEPQFAGSFLISGGLPLPAYIGKTEYSFISMAGGFLPIGAFLNISDLDSGSGAETLELRAFNRFGAAITSPWLSTPVATGGVEAMNALAFPSWNFDASTGAYFFNGATVTFVASVSSTMATEFPLGRLEVLKPNTNYSLSIAAPIPEPSTYGLLASGLALLAVWRGRHRTRNASVA